MLYAEMDLLPEIKKALVDMGFEKPSEIQEKSIPVVIEGKDVIGQAQTGTGKTAAFVIPALQLTDWHNQDIQHLIIAPTRELANQIADEYSKIGKYLKVRVAKIVGGVSYDRQRTMLKNKPHVVVGTPGRIQDLINKKKLKLSSIKTFTLDEADEMLKQGFLEDITEIIKSLPKQRVNLLFSATLDARIKKLASTMLNDPVIIQVSKGLTTKSTITQQMVLTKEKTKFAILSKFLEVDPTQVAVIFGRTKRRVDELSEALRQIGFKARGIQGDMAQKQRDFVMDGFKNGRFNILVATDVAARGIDVQGINFVYNFDLPQEIEYYTHRIGRTGRAGKNGTSISFVKPSELKHIERIAHQTSSEIEEIHAPSNADIKVRKFAKMEIEIEKMVAHDDVLKYVEFAKEQGKKFGQEALIAALIRDKMEETNSNAEISLTGEPGVSGKGGRGGSRGGSRGRSGGRSSGGRSSGGRSSGGRSSGGRSSGGRGGSDRSSHSRGDRHRSHGSRPEHRKSADGRSSGRSEGGRSSEGRGRSTGRSSGRSEGGRSSEGRSAGRSSESRGRDKSGRRR